MATASQRPPVPGPAFIRLLARLTDADVRPSSHALSDRLSQWIDWTRAVALSKALDGRLPATPIDTLGLDGSEGDEYARVRTTLMGAITSDFETARARQRGGGPASTGESHVVAAVDYPAFRERYLDLQRMMQAATDRLRGRLRDRLTQTSAEMARLAEVDAVMELTLSPREHALLASVPVLLGRHFERLREAAQNAPSDAQPPTDTNMALAGAWLDVFRADMQSVLLAELDVRFHPIEGLLAALRTR